VSDQLEYEEVEEGQGESPESSTIKQLREAADAANKRAKAAEKEARELREFKESQESLLRETTVKEKFREAGLPENAATLYLKDDTAPEDVTEWASQYGFTAGAAQSQTIAPPPGFTPTVGTPPGPQAMSRDEFDALVKTDPQAAFARATKQGVSWRHQASREIAGGK
jgi:hypothetical protein